jgi:26S proteasome regulatory subunit T3
LCRSTSERCVEQIVPLCIPLMDQGPRMVRDVFRLARENSPCIIFIDEVDAIATKRFDAQTGSDREVQRILLELLNQMDGFDQQTTVKVGSSS